MSSGMDGGTSAESLEHAGKKRTGIYYLLGLIIIFASVYSQYFSEYLGVHLGLIRGAFIVYGVPILTVTLLWGTTLIRRFFSSSYSALKFGLGFFGAFTVLGIILSAVILYVLMLFYPDTTNLLNKPNPVLNVSREVAWIMVGFSLLVIGPAEEYIFRGFLFGALLEIFRGHHWLTVAFASSLLFAAVHLYYAATYGLASLIQFTVLITFGMAMAATYYVSGGNLFIPSLIHGAYDATGYIGVAVSLDVGTRLREYMILAGVAVGCMILIQRTRRREQNSPSALVQPNASNTS
jgi:membrane protease YdiL (CAAX protease family)